VKIAAKDLEKAIAGLNVLVANHPDEVELCREEVARELKTALSSIRLSERGVYVQASTLGSLEALLEFLRVSQIPVRLSIYSEIACAFTILWFLYSHHAESNDVNH
jgi:translation initiation factor 5B